MTPVEKYQICQKRLIAAKEEFEIANTEFSQARLELMSELKSLVDPQTRGDPMSPLVWTTKSTRNLAGALTAAGHRVSDRTVARMLRAMGFSLQANAKVIEGRQHEDRDAQFDYLNRCVGEHIAAARREYGIDHDGSVRIRREPVRDGTHRFR